ncbi:hypothetical protein [Rossellomorea vietnamensis]
MNKKQYTEEELKELMEAPPTKEELEIIERILGEIPLEYNDKNELH